MKGRKHETADPSFRESALLVARILGPESCVLIGGLAVAAHGHERATKDVDFITRLSLADAKLRLVAHGLSVEVRRGDPDEGVPTFLRTTVAGIPVDVLPMLVEIDWARLPDVPLTHDTSIKVVDLDTLLLLKTRAGGMQDMLDVAQLAWRNLDRLPLARELAGRYDVRHKLEACLADRRERQKFVEGLPPEKRRRARDELTHVLDATDK